ncbi:MAG: ParB/RepB/Spo0J family partition protein [Christensenellales bacterium]|jgi:ParB family chromosome partitioning protein
MSGVKKGLGKGLNALFSMYEEEEEVIVAPSKQQKQSANIEGSVDEISISLIKPNVNQPRKIFDQDALKELSESIKVHGIIQPIVLNKEEDGSFMIIAGERRYRAAKLAGLEYVPAIIKNYTPKQVKEISIIENLQREDLNPIEAARAIKQLMEEYSFTQEEVADRIGKSRPAIANLLRLLTLSIEVVKMVEEGKLSAGHARALVTITNVADQIKIASLAKDNRISVRDLERVVKEYLNPNRKKATKIEEQSLELKELVSEMQRTFGTKVSIIGNDKKGRIYIDYYSRDDLDRMAQLVELVNSKTLTLKDLNNFNKLNKSN